MRTARVHAALLVVEGIVVGAWVAQEFVPNPRNRPEGDPAPTTLDGAAPTTAGDGRSVPRGPVAGNRLATWREIAGIDSAAVLEGRIERATAQATSSAREFELDVLRARLAVVDSSALVEAVRSIENPVAARRAALGAFDALGYTDAWIDRLAAVLPAAAGRYFRIEALERRVDEDPSGAFRAALALDDPLREAALRRVTVAWAERDPVAVAQMLSLVPRGQQFRVTEDLLSTWAREDPRGAVRFLEGTDSRFLVAASAIGQLEDLIEAYPDSAEIIIARMPVDYREAFDDHR